MKLSLFDYRLPKHLVAHKPVSPRDSCKLMAINRNNQSITHHQFSDLLGLLTPNDVLVLNQTKVIPARIFGKKLTGGKIEVLLIKQLTPNTWEAMIKPGVKPNTQIIFSPTLLANTVSANSYTVKLFFNLSDKQLDAALASIGHIPLPPYIHPTIDESEIALEYQTIYAKNPGSIASPTAGLHFTENLLTALLNRGIAIEYLTLHVGPGTFKPVESENIEDHTMHAESFSLDKTTALHLNQAKYERKRIIAVGTTTTRVLESQATDSQTITAKNGETNIFIYPPYKFKFVDALITNFHLPKSTLLMLISAFVSSPNSSLPFTDFNSSLAGQAYTSAIANNYRFYSFGDAMIIL